MTYATYPTPQTAAPQRPSTVTAIAILGIAFGAMALLYLPLNIFYMATGWKSAGPVGPAMWANDTFRIYMLVSTPLSALVSALYIVAGVGMLRMRAWAHKLAIGLIVFGMVSQLAGVLVMGPQMASTITSAMPALPPGGPDLSFMKPFMIGAIAFGTFIGLAIMAVLLVLLLRPDVRGAFAAAQSTLGRPYRM